MKTEYARKPSTVQRKPMRRKLIAVLVAACYSTAHAGLQAPVVVAGQASFGQQGKTYTITNTPNAILNWQGFSLATDEIARFVQQSADSRVLNRIGGQDPSVILGAIQSNGKVFLINPNGVLFGASAQVDVNGLVASSLALSNNDFLAGKNNFAGPATAGAVSNAGSIRTPAGGQVFLIAPAVENRGIISAPNGEVILAAGHSVQLFEASDPNVQVVVSSAADQALNLGQIVAQGGRIGVYGALVNQRGRISADSAVRGANGKIVLKSSATTLLEQGSSTTAVGSNLNVGGDIVVLGPQVGLTGDAVVDASGAAGGGSVLLGGDYQGGNPAIANAQQSYVGKDSVVRADALERGDGGKVIVWSDQRTRMYGNISARGGAQGGNGGLVETSGHVLDMQGRVDTLAPQGRTGTLLLDPGNIYIAADQSTATNAGMTGTASTASSGSTLFADSGSDTDTLLLTSSLQTALASNNVTVTTSNSALTGGSGKISVLSDVEWSSTRSLTLNAAGEIRIDAALKGENATLNLHAGDAIVQSTSPINAMRVSNLNAISAGDISLLNDDNRISNLTTLQASSGSAALSAKSVRLGSSSAQSSLSVQAMDGPLSVASNATLSTSGTLSLSAMNDDGAIVINSGAELIAAGTLSLSVPASGSERITVAGELTSENQIVLQAGKMTLAGATVTAPTVRLNTINSIELGTASDPADTLALASADLTALHTDALIISSQRSSSPGNIVASGALTLPASQTLTLNATGSIAVQAALSTGGLTLNADSDAAITASAAVSVSGIFELISGHWEQKGTLPAFSAADFRLTGGSFLRASGSDGTGASATPYVLTDIYGVQGIHTLALSNWYSLGSDIAASGTSGWNSGAGFKPLAAYQSPYTGTFNGNHHVISGLTINRPAEDYVGLFAGISNATVKNLTLSGGSVVGGDYVGGIAGHVASFASVLDQLNSSGSVTGTNNVGGLVGYLQGTLSYGAASGAVTGNAVADAGSIGGLVGRNVGSIEHSHASGNVSGDGAGYVGGLVGSNVNTGQYYIGSISTSYASGNVSSSGEIVGGLAGDNQGGNISKSYATGNVSGERNVGGLVGRSGLRFGYGGSIENAYATGNVSGTQNNNGPQHSNLGGLVGEHADGSINLVYSSGSVSAPGWSDVGGMIGADLGGTVQHAYYNSETAGLTAGAGTALTSAQMQQREYFSGFAFSNSPVWRIYENHTTPLLKDLLTPITVSVTGVTSSSRSYDGTSSTLSGASAGTLPGGISGTLAWTGGARNAGTYSIGGLYSTSYDISYAGSNAQLTITPREVTATVTARKNYDGILAVEVPANYTLTLHNVVASDTDLSLSGMVAFTNKDAGTGKALTVSNPVLVGNDLGNYVLTGTITGTGTIDKRPLHLSDVVLQSTRVYNGTDAISFTGGSSIISGLNGEEVSLATVGTATARYNNKNVGNNKPVLFTLSGYTLTGADAANYEVAGPAEAVASITAAPLSIAGVTAQDRVYNRTYDPGVGYGTLATLNTAGASLSGVLGNDVVTVVSARGSFDNRHVGTNKPVTGRAVTLGGTDGGNYQVTGFPSDMTASITPAPLTVTLASREYNNSAVGSFSSAVLSGVMTYGEGGSDSVTLVPGSATAAYVDKNVGAGKTVNFTGALSLSGTDAGNYTINPTGLGTITARPTSTWVGSGGGLWSAAANWADGIAPDGSNVLAAVLGSAADTITYDGTAGNTSVNTVSGGSGTALVLTGGTLTLNSGTSSLPGGVLTLNGGNLVMNASLDVTNLNLTSGTLSGSNSNATLTASHLTQTAGGLNIAGALAVGDGGNISLGTLRAQHGITLNAGEGGSITQTGGWTSDSLTANSTGGILLTSSANHLAAFTASSWSGNIELNNTAPGSALTLGALSTDGNILIDNVGGVVANGAIHAQHTAANRGRVAITAHSPVTINDTVEGNELAFSASTAIHLGSGAALNAVNHIQLTAGTDIVLGGSLAISSPSGSISATATNGTITVGSATSISSNGGSVNLSAPQGSVNTNNISYGSNTNPVVDSGSAAAAAAAAAAAQAAADAAAKAAADAAAKAAADAAAKAAADAAAKAAADAAAKAAADAAAEAAAKAAADAAAKAAADAAAKAAADAAAQAAADAAAKAAADAAAKAAAEAAAKAAAEAAAEAAAKAAAEAAAAKAAAEAAAKAAAEAAAQAAAEAAAKAAAEAAAGNGQPSEPITQAINNTIKLQNAVSGTTLLNTGVSTTPAPAAGAGGSLNTDGSNSVTKPVSSVSNASGGGSSGSSSGSTPPDDKVAEKSGDKPADKPAEQSKPAQEAPKKMYCN